MPNSENDDSISYLNPEEFNPNVACGISNATSMFDISSLLSSGIDFSGFAVGVVAPSTYYFYGQGNHTKVKTNPGYVDIRLLDDIVDTDEGKYQVIRNSDFDSQIITNVPVIRYGIFELSDTEVQKYQKSGKEVFKSGGSFSSIAPGTYVLVGFPDNSQENMVVLGCISDSIARQILEKKCPVKDSLKEHFKNMLLQYSAYLSTTGDYDSEINDSDFLNSAYFGPQNEIKNQKGQTDLSKVGDFYHRPYILSSKNFQLNFTTQSLKAPITGAPDEKAKKNVLLGNTPKDLIFTSIAMIPRINDGNNSVNLLPNATDLPNNVDSKMLFNPTDPQLTNEVFLELDKKQIANTNFYENTSKGKLDSEKKDAQAHRSGVFIKFYNYDVNEGSAKKTGPNGSRHGLYIYASGSYQKITNPQNNQFESLPRTVGIYSKGKIFLAAKTAINIGVFPHKDADQKQCGVFLKQVMYNGKEGKIVISSDGNNAEQDIGVQSMSIKKTIWISGGDGQSKDNCIELQTQKQVDDFSVEDKICPASGDKKQMIKYQQNTQLVTEMYALEAKTNVMDPSGVVKLLASGDLTDKIFSLEQLVPAGEQLNPDSQNQKDTETATVKLNNKPLLSKDGVIDAGNFLKLFPSIAGKSTTFKSVIQPTGITPDKSLKLKIATGSTSVKANDKYIAIVGSNLEDSGKKVSGTIAKIGD